MKGFIVSCTPAIENDATVMRVFGRLENNQSFCALIPHTPYWFIKESDEKKAKKLLIKCEIEKTRLTTFAEERVVKITTPSQADMNNLVKVLHKQNIQTFEGDVKPSARFIIDNELLGPVEISDKETHEPSEKVDRVYHNPTLTKTQFVPHLKVISLDIESDKSGDELFCIGMSSKNYKKCFVIANSKESIPNTVLCADERELLTKWKEEFLRFDPDIITGWNVIGFDIAFLRTAFAKHHIPFDIGRDNSNPRIKIEQGFFKTSTADIAGRQVLDALYLVKDPFIKEAPSIKHKNFTSYTLENVSQQILGEGKLLKGKGRHKEIEELFRKDQKKLVEYNLKDCELAYAIVEKTDMISLAVERASLTGMPLNKITSSIAAFDSLYIRKARERGLVSPTTLYASKEEHIQGGYVMQSEPNVYHNVIVLDFKSLYPSIITTFNIDPASFIEKPKTKKGLVISPNNAAFKNQEGILPEIIKTLHEAREKAKKEKRELSSYAIKIIMNSFFGVLASPNCRYFSIQMANAITHFGQYLIKLTAKKIEELGYTVIYSDTDSVFVTANASKEKAHTIGKEIERKINAFYNEFIQKEYNRHSYLELQFEKLYLAFMMPPVRHSDVASKKRYAGMLLKDGKEYIEVVGLEAIRGDWTLAAKEFQLSLLEKIFHKEEFVAFIRSYVKKIEDGKLDEKLIYKKSLTKPLEAYVKTTPPHVKAARKLPKLESKVVEYVITLEGPEPTSHITHKLDYKHYIQKQIKPIADTLLFFFDKKFDDIISSSKQMKLF